MLHYSHSFFTSYLFFTFFHYSSLFFIILHYSNLLWATNDPTRAAALQQSWLEKAETCLSRSTAEKYILTKKWIKYIAILLILVRQRLWVTRFSPLSDSRSFNGLRLDRRTRTMRVRDLVQELGGEWVEKGVCIVVQLTWGRLEGPFSIVLTPICNVELLLWSCSIFSFKQLLIVFRDLRDGHAFALLQIGKVKIPVCSFLYHNDFANVRWFFRI